MIKNLTDEEKESLMVELEEAQRLSAEVMEIFRGERVNVIHLSMSIIVEFLQRHTGLDCDLLQKSVVGLKAMHDAEGTGGSVEVGILSE